MISIMIILTAFPAHPDSVSCRGPGVGEGRDNSRAVPRVPGPSGPCPWRCHQSLGPPSRGSQCPHDCPCLESSPIRGAFKIQCRHRLQGWVSGGAGLILESWPLLPAAGRASALLHRVGAEQGSEGAVGWGATTLHLEVGSQDSVLAGAPLRGGQGIWKESRRVGLGSTHRCFHFCSLASKGSAVPSEDRAFYSCMPHSFTHSHSFIHSSTNDDQGWAPGPEEEPVTTCHQGEAWKAHSRGNRDRAEHCEEGGGRLLGRELGAGPEVGLVCSRWGSGLSRGLEVGGA